MLKNKFVALTLIIWIILSFSVAANDKEEKKSLWDYIQHFLYKPFKQDKQKKSPFIIAIAGGSASGKTCVCNQIKQALSNNRFAVISQDNFYKNLSPEDKERAAKNNYNFDHPNAIDFEALEDTLKKLKEGSNVTIPIYDFTQHARTNQTESIHDVDVIIVEGILIFVQESLLPYMDVKLFVDTDADIRLLRRIKRDIAERGRDLESVLEQYEKFVKPMHDHYIGPSKKHADIIIPYGGENVVAIDLIVSYLADKMKRA